MKKSTLLVLAIAITFVCLNGASFFIGLGVGRYQRPSRVTELVASPTPPLATEAEQDDNLAVLDQVWDIIQRDFYSEQPLDNKKIAYAAIRGLLDGLDDPHTSFFDPPSNEIKKSDYEGKFGGIGAYIGLNDAGEAFISAVIPDNPAEAAGLLAGDVIIAIDAQSVEGLLQDEIVLLVRGPIESTVVLTIRRAGQDDLLDFRIERAEIKQPTVLWEPVAGTSFAHIQLTFFAGPTGDELVQALDEIAQAGMTSIILDLRGNRGGLLASAGEVAAQFIPDGVLLYERIRAEDGSIEDIPYMIPDGYRADADIPLVVLVDGGTASASEIVAGAIQDDGRGILIGTQTYGKGSMQYIYELIDKSSLHVTAAHWLTPNRRPLNGVGLEPDIIESSQPTSDTDPVLERAVQWLENGE